MKKALLILSYILFWNTDILVFKSSAQESSDNEPISSPLMMMPWERGAIDNDYRDYQRESEAEGLFFNMITIVIEVRRTIRELILS